MAKVAGKTSYNKSSKKSLEELLASKKTIQQKTLEQPIDNVVQENNDMQEQPIQREISFNELQDLFGEGFNERELRAMYRIYSRYLNNYPIKTVLHEGALARAVRYEYREISATAEGDTEAAAKWGKLAKDARTDAKMNPSQLSAADLSDGMTSFSQLSATVEKAQDIIPLLPQFVEEPKDRVDYTLWEYINYARHLDGKPLIEYKDLYKFLQARYESLKKRYQFMKKEEDGHFDENDIDSEV